MITITAKMQIRKSALDDEKDFKAAVNAELAELGLFWHEKYLPLHFKDFAPFKYSGIFKPRTAKWEKRKKNKLPMVGLTGSARQEALSRATIVNTRSGIAVRFPRPHVVNLHLGKNGGINMLAELTAICGEEVERFAVRLDQGVQKRMNPAAGLPSIYAGGTVTV